MEENGKCEKYEEAKEESQQRVHKRRRMRRRREVWNYARQVDEWRRR